MTRSPEVADEPGFRHEAFLYAGDDEYLAGVVPFIEEGLEAGSRVLVAVPAPRAELLRDRFASRTSALLEIASMERMGRNPAWIIPAWAAFVGAHHSAARPARGIGEPIWAGRSAAELIECERHEALLNLAFADATGFRLLCPYDVSSLAASTIEEAHRNHPHVRRCDSRAVGRWNPDRLPIWLSAPLAPIPDSAERWRVTHDSVGSSRRRVARLAASAGARGRALDRINLAVGEALGNSVLHGGGSGELAVWLAEDQIVCELRDQGRIADPLAGRVRPSALQLDGRGLWLVHQCSDLVQHRVHDDGQVLRMHLRIRG